MILRTVAQSLVNMLELHQFTFLEPNTSRGEEVAVALDFVRGMDEEGLKLLLDQGEVRVLIHTGKWFQIKTSIFNRCSD